MIKDDMKNILETAKKLDYISLRTKIFGIIKSDEIKKYINKKFIYDIAKLLDQDDFFEIFYMNSDLRVILKPFIIEMLNTNKHYLTTDQMLSVLFSCYDSDQDIEYYFPIFLENTNNLIELKDQVEIYDNLLTQVYDYMDNNPSKTIQDLIKKNFSYFKIYEINDDEPVNKMERIIMKVLNNENVNASDIVYIGIGSNTVVTKIGTKVIKFSVNKRIFPKVSHPRILEPLSNVDLLLNNSEGMSVSVEVNHYVDTDNITTEDVYEVFKDLLNQNLIWTDPNPHNLGRIYINEKEYFVIIDSEYIYKRDYPDITLGNQFYHNQFLNRYISEQENKLVK